ncbi:MAG TPA: hypothetical protein VKB78_07930, partial [Pirellulales bacterium]|nr:hypothetical protein [Pirellulales bacterium]
MQRRHRSGLDPAEKAIAEHQVVPGSELLDKTIERRKIVAVVRIAYDDEIAEGGLDTSAQRVSVSLLVYRDDARASSRSNRLRAIRAAVVGDDDLAIDVVSAQIGNCLGDAVANRFRLVEARHDDR